MKTEDCTQIAYVVKLHGYKGGLSISVESSFSEYFKKIEMFYLLIADQLTPFFISERKKKSDTSYYIKLDGVNSEEAARSFLKSSIYVATADLPTISLEEEAHQYLIGYTILEKNEGIIGEVEGVIEHPSNPLMIVNYQEKEVLIPIQDDFILAQNDQKKEIEMDLPEGLLDL